jgi:hypothetical protein
MSVITVKKSYDDVHARLAARADLKVVVLGCDKCAKLSQTGGAAEVRAMREQLRASGLMLEGVTGLVDAIEEGACDPVAVAERLGPLAARNRGELQIVLLACGAGLKCVHDTLPGVRLVPGLDTLGPGVKSELACLACGDCQFDQGGCRRLAIVEEQTRRLARSYPRSVA